MDTSKNKPGVNRLLRSNSTLLQSGKKVAIGPQSKPKPSDSSGKCQPSIELKQGEQGVDFIEVVCACGERIVIRCEYDQ